MRINRTHKCWVRSIDDDGDVRRHLAVTLRLIFTSVPMDFASKNVRKSTETHRPSASHQVADAVADRSLRLQ